MGAHVRQYGNIGGLLADVSTAKAHLVVREVDNEVGQMADEISRRSGNNAPVETGLLRSELYAGARRVEELNWIVMEGIYDKIPYLWRQNFEHQSKGLFFTTAFNEIEALYGSRLQKAVDRQW